jgi:rhamnosyltransferase
MSGTPATRPTFQASVIVRSKDSARTIGETLTSLRAQTVPVEIVVVDSGSSDRTLEIAQPLSDIVVEMPASEFTFGRALNIGAQHASGDIHFALSSHCVPRNEQWVARSLEHYADPSIAGTNGATFHADLSHPLLEPVMLTFQDAQREPYWGFSNHASSWRASVWREFSFNEEIEACEDKEWSWRVLKAGWRIAMDPRLVVSGEHRRQAGTRALFQRVRREARALTTYAELAPFTLADAIGEWWGDIPEPTAHPPLFHRLNYLRAADVLGRYIGQWEGRRARELRSASG